MLQEWKLIGSSTAGLICSSSQVTKSAATSRLSTQRLPLWMSTECQAIILLVRCLIIALQETTFLTTNKSEGEQVRFRLVRHKRLTWKRQLKGSSITRYLWERILKWMLITVSHIENFQVRTETKTVCPHWEQMTSSITLTCLSKTSITRSLARDREDQLISTFS